jgi:broad specificity phosphatase PhoE
MLGKKISSFKSMIIIENFTGIYTSDLQRSWDTSVISLGFPEGKIKKEKRLREIYFGEDEGKHFDSLSEAD